VWNWHLREEFEFKGIFLTLETCMADTENFDLKRSTKID
jgi:hypothetical protein